MTSILQLLSFSVFAQKGDLDYYAPRSDYEKVLLGNVERYHIGPGHKNLDSGNYTGALDDFEFVLRYFPNHPQGLSGLSALCLKWKSPTCEGVAERRFQAAIARNPEASQSHVVLAFHLHRKNKLDEAVKHYKRAVELAPDSINAHYNLGLAYTDRKEYDLANLHAQKSYALGVTLPGLRTRLQNVGKWNPNVTLPAPATKTADTPTPPTPPTSPEKTPD